jgi:predicted Zn finger-like uncharacterized protein
VVVICPKCKAKLKVNDAKLTEGGSRFKCPKCATVLLVKKPQPVQEKPVDSLKILVAHSHPSTTNEIIVLLNKNGYQAITASDGIEAMVKAIRELPFLAIIEVSLPKIYGFEVCKRLKTRPETKEMKFILISSPYDKNRYKRHPESLYDADDYIEEHRIAELLIDSIAAFRSGKAGKAEEKVQKPAEPPSAEKPEQKTEPAVKPKEQTTVPPADDRVERARRLARTIISDIYLYNTAKADEAIKKNSFAAVFAAELREGLKLYDSRIPQEIRSQEDYFQQVLNGFIENKKKSQ